MWDRNQNIINIALFDFLFISGLTEVWQALYSAQLVSEFDNFKQRIIITLKASPQNERYLEISMYGKYSGKKLFVVHMKLISSSIKDYFPPSLFFSLISINFN